MAYYIRNDDNGITQFLFVQNETLRSSATEAAECYWILEKNTTETDTVYYCIRHVFSTLYLSHNGGEIKLINRTEATGKQRAWILAGFPNKTSIRNACTNQNITADNNRIVQAGNTEQLWTFENIDKRSRH